MRKDSSAFVVADRFSTRCSDSSRTVLYAVNVRAIVPISSKVPMLICNVAAILTSVRFSFEVSITIVMFLSRFVKYSLHYTLRILKSDMRHLTA